MTEIVNATKNDIGQLISFGREEFTRTFGHLYDPKDLADYLVEGYQTSLYEHWIESDDYHIFAAFNDEGALVGYSLVSPCGLPLEKCGHDIAYAATCGEIKRMYIHPSTFGTGLANELMMTSLNWLKGRNYGDRIYLGVFSENFRAQKFYHKHGFEKVGEYGFEVGDHIDREFIFKLKP